MGLPPDGTSRSHAERLAGYGAVSTALALLSDRRLGKLLDEAPLARSSIGGTAIVLEIEGTPVFVKRVPLTDLERRPDNVMSTANLFELPTFYQYGVGSAGFGVWRELAAHTMTTNWVLGGRCASFPLMYHWRVLEGPPPRTSASDMRGGMARTVEFWEGSAAVRERLEAIEQASASVVLFLEHIPQNLYDWLPAQLAAGDDAVRAACSMIERSLRADVGFMNANGLLHFDAHFGNVLTDGRRLYLTDFGLALSPRFELSSEEAGFLGANLSHDACHTVTQLVDRLVTASLGVKPAERNRFVRRCAEGQEPAGLSAPAAAVVKRYAPVAAVINDFYWKLHAESRTTPFPVDDVERACAAAGFGR